MQLVYSAIQSCAALDLGENSNPVRWQKAYLSDYDMQWLEHMVCERVSEYLAANISGGWWKKDKRVPVALFWIEQLCSVILVVHLFSLLQNINLSFFWKGLAEVWNGILLFNIVAYLWNIITSPSFKHQWRVHVFKSSLCPLV